MFRRFLSTYPKYTVHSKQYSRSTVGDNTKVKTIPAPAPKPPPVPPPSGVWFIP